MSHSLRFYAIPFISYIKPIRRVGSLHCPRADSRRSTGIPEFEIVSTQCHIEYCALKHAAATNEIRVERRSAEQPIPPPRA